MSSEGSQTRSAQRCSPTGHINLPCSADPYIGCSPVVKILRSHGISTCAEATRVRFPASELLFGYDNRITFWFCCHNFMASIVSVVLPKSSLATLH